MPNVEDTQHRTAHVAELIPGDRVDLESCPYLKDDPSAKHEYATVYGYPWRSAPRLIAVPYENLGVIHYGDDQLLVIVRRHLLPAGHLEEWAEGFRGEKEGEDQYPYRAGRKEVS